MWFVAAAVVGLLHAAASAYWTFGGTWLLDTVGEFAVEMQRTGGLETRLMLGAVTVAKAAGALVPMLDHVRPPAHRWVRIVSWLGVVVLSVWGLAGMVGAWIALANRRAAPGDPAILGHAFLWDPMFVAWAGFLAAGLLRSRGWWRESTPRPA